MFEVHKTNSTSPSTAPVRHAFVPALRHFILPAIVVFGLGACAKPGDGNKNPPRHQQQPATRT